MSKRVLMNTIGKAIVDTNFRKKFNFDPDGTIDGLRGLTNGEKEFLKSRARKIRDLSRDLNVRYSGESKRN